jgi:hypothetical protein
LGLSDADIEKKILEEEERKVVQVKDKTVDNWKPGMRRRPCNSGYSTLEEFRYELEPDKQKQSPVGPYSTSAAARSYQSRMMPVWDEWGVRHPCTVLLVPR